MGVSETNKCDRELDCSSCKCGRDYHTLYNLHANCEHWERDTCPVSRERIGVPYVNYYDSDSYYRSNCSDCSYAMHLPNNPHCYDGTWHSGHTHYMYECEHYKKSTMKTVPCLNGHVIQRWSDGYIFCPICESNGCDGCYEEFMREMEEGEQNA